MVDGSRSAAAFPLLRCLVVCGFAAATAVAHDQKSAAVAYDAAPRSRRSIIAVPSIRGRGHPVHDRALLAADYNGMLFVERGDGEYDEDDRELVYYSPLHMPLHTPQPQPPPPPLTNKELTIKELLLALIENVREKNGSLQRQMVNQEIWRKFQWVLSDT